MYCVDVDTGGTMTDTLVSGGAAPVLIKVESTPHDVTVSFMQSLERAAEALGFKGLGAFLDEVRLIRWSSTITSNVLAERKGPRLGLVVSPGHADDLYAGDPADTATVMPSLIRPEHVTTLDPRAGRAEIVAVLKNLIDQGIRRVNISLAGAFPDGAREQAVLNIIGEQFPDHFLGSVPALAGSEMLMQPDDMSRTFYALINAYVHNALANSLFKAEDQVKVEHNWRGDILVGHLNGGVARIGKTKAVDTIESGPLFGTHASAHVAAACGDMRVLAMDIGGTTGKSSAISDGRIEMRSQGHIFGIPVRMPMPVLRSNALGGGSIARVADGRVTLGPESMGAAPGPACYGLGGSNATLTDALVALGAISPTAFLDGRRVLDVARAEAALEQHVAAPLACNVAAAARAVLDCAVAMMAGLARDTAGEVGWTVQDDVTLYAYGGNGPLFGTLVAAALGVERVRLFALGTVFSAFGSATSDVLHVYERALTDGADAAALAAAGAALARQARRDLAGEGFDPGAASYHWTVQNDARERFAAEGDIDTVAAALAAGLADASLLRLDARFAIGQVTLPAQTAGGAPAPTGERASPLGRDGYLPVYAHASLHGHAIAGPAVVDGGTFTWLIGGDWRLTTDANGNALATREGKA
ncbi:MAG: hydantoinase/oxoprolinase family protein [Gammaproteobacteria bacterium]|nr:hydantoinase/oxoprolinase family protein [Gammaproteobacteria bacterium]